MDIYCDGKVLTLTDYRSLEVHGCDKPTLNTTDPEKGHKEILQAFAEAIESRQDASLPLWQQLQATRTAFQVENAVARQPIREAA